MTKTLPWLLAGAAATLLAGAALAAETKTDKDETRVEERRTVRVYRADRPAVHHDRDVVVVRHKGEHGGGRAKYLSAVLQLRAEQEPALKTFLEATQGERSRHQTVRLDRDDDRSTADKLAEMEAKMAAQQASMKTRIDATRAFYNQLDAKQKKAFDAMPMLMMVGPDIGPIMLPGPMPMPVVHRDFDRFEFRFRGDDDDHVHPVPPVPPVPPAPPAPPRPRL